MHRRPSQRDRIGIASKAWSPRTCSGVHGAALETQEAPAFPLAIRWTPEQVRGDEEKTEQNRPATDINPPAARPTFSGSISHRLASAARQTSVSRGTPGCFATLAMTDGWSTSLRSDDVLGRNRSTIAAGDQSDAREAPNVDLPQGRPVNNPSTPARWRSAAPASRCSTAATASASPGTRPASRNSPARR